MNSKDLNNENYCVKEKVDSIFSVYVGMFRSSDRWHRAAKCGEAPFLRDKDSCGHTIARQSSQNE